jgi:hypothetical protein
MEQQAGAACRHGGPAPCSAKILNHFSIPSKHGLFCFFARDAGREQAPTTQAKRVRDGQHGTHIKVFAVIRDGAILLFIYKRTPEG